MNEVQEWVDSLRGSTCFRFFKDGKGSHDEYWREFAVYDDYIRQSRYPGAVLDRVAGLVMPGAKIIDIGSGTGAFAIPLAEWASEVIAVDPSSYHLGIVASKCIERGIVNITPVNAEWKDVERDRYPEVLENVDYALAAYSIIDPDIENFLQKMYDTASKGIFTVYRAGERDPLDEFAYGDRKSIDYRCIMHVMENMGMDVRAEFFKRDYKLPLPLAMHLFRNSERSESEFYHFILENERLDSSSGEEKVIFSATDTLLYVLKNDS
jgi:predicted RNA methylase